LSLRRPDKRPKQQSDMRGNIASSLDIDKKKCDPIVQRSV